VDRRHRTPVHFAASLERRQIRRGCVSRQAVVGSRHIGASLDAQLHSRELKPDGRVGTEARDGGFHERARL